MRRKIPDALIFAAAIAVATITSFARPALVNEKQSVPVFPGQNRLSLLWTNQGSERIDAEIKGRVFRESSALAMRLPIEVKGRLQLLPNQAALMQVSFEVPDFRTKSLLLIRWEDASQVIGKTELTVYSRDVLHELEMIVGEKGIGIAGVDERFKAAFRRADVRFEEFEEGAISAFAGAILILTECPNTAAIAAAKRGVVVICVVQPGEEDVFRPNFFAIRYGRGVVVLAQGDLLANFDTNPESQLRLVQICRMATKPGRPELPMILRKDSNED
jgi:hypothetical protein